MTALKKAPVLTKVALMVEHVCQRATALVQVMLFWGNFVILHFHALILKNKASYASLMKPVPMLDAPMAEHASKMENGKSNKVPCMSIALAIFGFVTKECPLIESVLSSLN